MKCRTCKSGYFLTGTTCATSCPGGIPATSSNICLPCISPCNSCQGSTTFCTSCVQGSIFQGTCVQICPDFTYQAMVGSISTCVPCVSPCDKCTGPSSSSCISCLSGFFLEGTSCSNVCPIGKYKNSIQNICSVCHPFCSSCFGEENSSCNTCNPGFTQMGSTCSSNCL